MMMYWNLTGEADPVHLILTLTVHLRNTPGVNPVMESQLGHSYAGGVPVPVLRQYIEQKERPQ